MGRYRLTLADGSSEDGFFESATVPSWLQPTPTAEGS